MSVPKKASDRISAGLRKFQPVLTAAKARDINESDTVVIVTDVLQEVFGYDKYSDITSEHMIRGTFCDLAIKCEGALSMLIEVKAVGLELRENFVKQAVDYAANQGCEWVALTNGHSWKVFHVTFAKPIEHEVVVEFDLLTLNHRSGEHIDTLALISKEGWQRARLGDYHSRKQAFNRFTVAAILMTEAVVDVVRRELRRVSPGLKVDEQEVRDLLSNDILKREVIDGDKAAAARRHVARSAGKQLRATSSEAGRDHAAIPSGTLSQAASAPCDEDGTSR